MGEVVDFKRDWTYAELQALQREAAKLAVRRGGEIREGDHVFGRSGLCLGRYPGLAAEMGLSGYPAPAQVDMDRRR